MAGVVVGEGGFELVAGGHAVGARRFLDAGAVEMLEGLASRYEMAARDGDAGVLLGLGRQLYGWLDGDEGRLSRLRELVVGPFVFEVRGPGSPSAAEWALLQAPFELLADADGFLTQDALLQFCVVRRLGSPVPAEPLDGFRLGLAFMASSPRGQVELDYEAEEAAILEAVGEANLDLVVEESGDPEQLGDRLAELGRMPAVHLSCHGLNRWSPDGQSAAEPRPVLMMEDAEGNDRPTDAGELIRCLRVASPRLVVVSACLSAATGGEGRGSAPLAGREGEAGRVAHSLASALVGAGVPAEVGWHGSVADTAATEFALVLYRGLAGRQDVALAVGDACRALLACEDERVRRDWHLARLWVGPRGGGAIVGGGRKRSLVPATHGQKAFLAKQRRQVPVASHEMFVGRRRQLQQALRMLRGGDHGGVLLHGMGRLGKSSLAARIANRRKDLALAVVFEHYGALSVLEALTTALRSYPAAREVLAPGTDLVREDPLRLEEVLIDLLNGPCQQADGDRAPVLLVIDDLERILVPGPGGAHRVDVEHAGVLAAVLRAFDPAETDSRLLVTSRHPFHLEGLEARLHLIQLPPLSPVEQRKLQQRQADAARDPTRTRRLDQPEFQARRVLAERVPDIARGNPGLQDLIGLKLVFSEHVAIDRAAQTLDEMGKWLGGGDLPDEAQVREFLEDLAIDRLHEHAGAAGRELLRAVTLFDLPVPTRVVETLAETVGGSVDALRSLGLVDVFEDVLDSRAHAVAVNALSAARLDQLSEAERAAVAVVVVGPLFDAWGCVEGHLRRPRAADLQIAVVGLLAGDAHVVATCAADAVALLSDGSAAGAADLGGRAIALLDRHAAQVPLALLSNTAEAAATAGEGRRADELLERAATALEAEQDAGQAIDPRQAALIAAHHGRRLATRGELNHAQREFERAVELFEQAGSEREAVVVRGDIADVLFARGELDEALRIRQEELPVYERLGDVRSRAVTWGQIADVLFARGELDEALRIRQEEQLPVYERLDDVDGIAAALWGLAQIDLARGDIAAAAPRIAEAWTLLAQLGRTDGIAVVGQLYGQLLIAGDQRDAGMDVLRMSSEAYRKLGRYRKADEVAALLRELTDPPDTETEA
ncbi:MAG: CHAT domain-containing protein [Egibacteraceae bacterium]